MPGYELSLIMKALQGPALKEAVKRSVALILENGGIVRKIEYLGEKRLPYRIRIHNENFVIGRYFLVDFHAPTTLLPIMQDYFRREIDVIRPAIFRTETEADPVESCGGVYDELYQPKLTKKRKFKKEVQEKLKDIKL